MPKFNKMKRKEEIEARLQQIDEEFRLLGEGIKSASKMMAKIERELETIENALSEEQKKTEKKKVSEIKRRIHTSSSKSR
jgi:prefoldin subunit 5